MNAEGEECASMGNGCRSHGRICDKATGLNLRLCCLLSTLLLIAAIYCSLLTLIMLSSMMKPTQNGNFYLHYHLHHEFHYQTQAEEMAKTL